MFALPLHFVLPNGSLAVSPTLLVETADAELVTELPDLAQKNVLHSQVHGLTQVIKGYVIPTQFGVWFADFTNSN